MPSLVEAYINNPSLMRILAANNYFFHENSRDDILTLCEAKHNTRLVRFDWIINTWQNCLPFCEQNSTSQLERTLWWNKLHGGWPAGTNRNGNFKSKASQSGGFINLQSTSAWGRLNIKMSFYQYRIPIIKIRRSCDRLIFIMESHIWKDRLYIETGPRWARHEICRVHRRENGIKSMASLHKILPTPCTAIV